MIPVILLTLGSIGCIVSRMTLGDSYSMQPNIPSKLVTRGIYKKIRHPIYVFSLVNWWGLSLLYWVDSALPFLICITLIQYYRAQNEEEILEKEFGKEYLDYKERTWF